MAWSFEVTNKNFVSQGEFVNVRDSKVDIQLNKLRTAGLKIRLDNTLAPFIALNCSLEPLYIKAYRNGILLFNGPIQTVQEANDNQNAFLQINASGPEMIFTQRLLRSGLIYCTDAGIKTPSGTQRAVQFKEMLKSNEEQGAENRGQLHIDYTTGPIESANIESYEAPSYKLLSEILTEMYNQAAGFDWVVYPQETTEFGPKGKIGRLVIQNTIHTEKPNAAFEWGGGRNNIAGFSRTVDISSLLNLGWNISSAGPNATGAPTIYKYEETPYAETWNIREGMVSINAQNIDLRQQITTETTQVRRLPKQTVVFQPVADVTGGEGTRVPVFGSDYNIGDSVKAKIMYEGATHLTGLSRVWGVGFAVDENGKETQTLTLSDS